MREFRLCGPYIHMYFCFYFTFLMAQRRIHMEIQTPLTKAAHTYIHLHADTTNGLSAWDVQKCLCVYIQMYILYHIYVCMYIPNTFICIHMFSFKYASSAVDSRPFNMPSQQTPYLYIYICICVCAQITEFLILVSIFVFIKNLTDL